MAAEAERVGQRRNQFLIPCLIGHDIQITLGIGCVVVDRGGNNAVLKGEYARHQLSAAAREFIRRHFVADFVLGSFDPSDASYADRQRSHASPHG